MRRGARGRIGRELTLLVCAVQFLTRLPTPRLHRFEPDWIPRAARYYPLAGQLVGLLAAAVLLLGARMWRAPLPALLAVAAGALITGGFHEDGLADTFDGLGGGRTPERRLEIMKDSRLGTYGVLALGLVTALRAAALGAQPPLAAALSLVFAHGAARALAVAAFALLPYAGDPGAAKRASPGARPTPGEAVLALALGVWPALLLPPRQALAGFAIALPAALVMAVQARRLLGGQTGDVLGAVEQLAESGFLLGKAL